MTNSSLEQHKYAFGFHTCITTYIQFMKILKYDKFWIKCPYNLINLHTKSTTDVRYTDKSCHKWTNPDKAFLLEMGQNIIQMVWYLLRVINNTFEAWTGMWWWYLNWKYGHLLHPAYPRGRWIASTSNILFYP